MELQKDPVAFSMDFEIAKTPQKPVGRGDYSTADQNPGMLKRQELLFV
jgi:hypothetical protein